jgi:hypothetical protein
MRLGANSVRIAWNTALSPRLTMRLGAGYSREEYAEGLRRDRFEGGINFIYALKMK